MRLTEESTLQDDTLLPSYKCNCNLTAVLHNGETTLKEKNSNNSTKKQTTPPKILTHIDLLNKAWETHNILLEKLGTKNSTTGAVNLQAPILSHRNTCIENELSKNGKASIESAKKKAIDWCCELNANIGTAVKIVEGESSCERFGDEEGYERIDISSSVEITFSIVRNWI